MRSVDEEMTGIMEKERPGRPHGMIGRKANEERTVNSS